MDNTSPHPASARVLRSAQCIDVTRAELNEWPLDPASIVEGDPRASGLTLSRSQDGRMVRGIWACTPGVFRWTWNYDETLVVVSGEATVKLAGGEIELRPGDLAFFERGQSSVWRIKTALRKGFHAAADEPLPF